MKYFKYIFRALFLPAALVISIFIVTANLFKNKSLKIVNQKIKAVENVSFILRDKHGSVKKLFKVNFIGKSLARAGYDIRNMLTGAYVEELTYSNLITNVGFAGASAIIGAIGTPAPYTYIALGTGTTAANATDTTLETETAAAGLVRAIGTSITQTTTTVIDDTLTVSKTFTNTSGGTVSVSEAGLLNASSGGTLFARRVFTAVGIDDTDSLQTTWNIKCS